MLRALKEQALLIPRYQWWPVHMYVLTFVLLQESDLYAGTAEGWQCVQRYKLQPDEPMSFIQAMLSTWLLEPDKPPNRQPQQ